MAKIKYLNRLDQIPELTPPEQTELKPVGEQFVFRSNDYYQSLIDWDDPKDPIRAIIMPDAAELAPWGRLDASDEESYSVAPGVEHKYTSTALLLVNDVCGGYCRFCFRKRLFMDDNDEVTRDISAGIDYIKSHPEISNVLLTGGDPLIMSTRKLRPIIEAIRDIEHVKIIRLGSKMTAFNPFRVLADPDLIALITAHSQPEKRIYIMNHFNHPRELTPEAVKAVDALRRAGAVVVNQTPLIRGVNDDPEVLGELFQKLSFAGIPPYYVFQCRPTLGNKPFAVPIEEGYAIFERARMLGSGLAKRARYVMSHATGKIEVVGRLEGYTYFKYHRAAQPEDNGRFIKVRSNPEAYWFDDYEEVLGSYSVDNPYRCFGPE